jgi:transposase
MSWSRGKAYAQDLRDRVFTYADGGQPVGVVARTLLVSVSYVSKVLGRRHSTGETAARPQRCHVPAKLAHLHQAIREHVRAHPDATLAELRTWLRETHQVSSSLTLLSETLSGLGLTLKKSPSTRPNRTATMSRKRASNGSQNNPGSIPTSLSSLMKAGSRPT